MKNLKIAAFGVVGALGLATTAVAQQPSGSMPGMTAEQHRQMMSRSDPKGKSDMMMNHGEMAQMMDRCEKMMKMMEDKPAAPTTKR